MGALTFTGQGQKIPQVSTVTPGSPGIGNAFNITVGGTKVLTFLATDTTVANVTAGLAGLIGSTSIPEISELTALDGTTFLSLTGPPDGTPFTLASSASGGSATCTSATLTNGSGPNYANVAANYSTGALPSSGDDLTVSSVAPAIKFGLDTHAIVLNSLTIPQGYSGQGEGFGLPQTNAKGYPEYRPRYWQIGATTLDYGGGSGQGNGRGYLNLGSGGCTGLIRNTGGTLETGVAALNILCTGTNTFEVLAGTVAFGPLPSDAPAVATINNINGVVYVGPGTTLVTSNTDGGTTTIECAATTVYCESGSAVVNGSGAVVNLTAFKAGAIQYNSSGTVTNASLKYGGTIDTSDDIRTKIFTNTTFTLGGTLIYSSNPLTHTNKPIFTDVRTIAAS